MKIKRRVVSVLAGCMTMVITVGVMAASTSLDGAKCTWYGGMTADEVTIYSKVWDNELDGRRYSVTVWAKDDKGDTSSFTDTTSAVGAKGEVAIYKPATHSNPFVKETCGYNSFSVVD